jgi:hypothetical protein
VKTLEMRKEVKRGCISEAKEIYSTIREKERRR